MIMAPMMLMLRTTLLRLVLLLVLLLTSLPFVRSNVSVNLKSKVLTDILRSDNKKDPSPGGRSTQPSAGQTSSRPPHGGRDASDILKLDLSGRLNLHLWGIPEASASNGERIRPLLPLAAVGPPASSISSRPPVSIKLGLDYDLSDRQQQQRGWYGVQRVLASLGWKRRQQQQERATASADASKLKPRRVEFTVERGINTVETDSTYAGHVKVGWDDPLINDTNSGGGGSLTSSSRLPFVKMGLDLLQNKKSNDALMVGAMTCSIPLHRRLLWRGKISRPLCTLRRNQQALDGFGGGGEDGDAENFDSSNSSRIPMPAVSDLNDVSSWLIPDVTVNAMGQMESNTQAWFPMSTLPSLSMLKRQQERHDNDDDGRLGIRLTIRRQFDWDYPLLLSGLLGSSSSSNSNNMHDSAMTAICLEIKGMTPRTITTARFETSLEEPLEAAHLSILQYLDCE